MDRKVKRAKRLVNLKGDNELALFDTVTEIQDEIENLKVDFIKELSSLKDEVKKKEAEEITFEIDPESIRGEKGDKGEQGIAGKDGQNGRDGRNGLNGLDGRDGADGKNGINGRDGVGIDGKDGSPDTPQQIADKLNTLFQQIDPKVIRGYSELERIVKNGNFDVRIGVSKTELVALQKQVAALSTSSGGTWYSEALTEIINSSNKVFTLSHIPTSPNSLVVYLGHQPQIKDVDYTLSGLTITYTTAPDSSLSGDHYAKYQ